MQIDLSPAIEYGKIIIPIVGKGAIFGGLLGILLGALLLWQLSARQLLRRPKPLWNFCTKLFFPYLLLISCVAGIGFGALFAAHRYVDQRITEVVTPLAEAELPSVKHWLVRQAKRHPNQAPSLSDAAAELLAPFYYPPKSDSLIDRAKTRVVNYFTLNLGKWVIAGLVGAAWTYAAGRAGNSLGVDGETIKGAVAWIRDIDLSRSDRNIIQLFETAIQKRFSDLFSMLYLHTLLYLALLLSPVLLESAYYFRFYKRRTVHSDAGCQ